MIIRCKQKSDITTIINGLRNKYPNLIVNYVHNEVFGVPYIFANGQTYHLEDDVISGLGGELVFRPSGDKRTFFVDDKSLIPQFSIGRNEYRSGDKKVSVIAGPCEIESFDELYATAYELKKVGISVFRAMPEKPRSSPYSFQGVGKDGYEYLNRIKKELDIPVLSEVFSQEDINLAIKNDIDIIQIGSRNMMNYDLIKRAAKSGITTVLKKGMWCSNEQLLGAAEYFFVYGQGNVILCERGIQTHEHSTRNTFDISSILYLKSVTNLPVMADPSHGTGVKDFVSSVSCTAAMLGADILEIEVTRYPDETIKPGDGYQILNIEQYKKLLKAVMRILHSQGKMYDWE